MISFLNIYTTQYDKRLEDLKKRVNVLNKPQSLTLVFDKDDLPLEGDEELKLEPEETIAERIKLNSQKRKVIKNLDSKQILTSNYKRLKQWRYLVSTKKLIDKTKNGENVPSQVDEVVLVQRNLLDNQYQQKSEVLYNFTPSTSYTYLLNVKPSNLEFLK